MELWNSVCGLARAQQLLLVWFSLAATAVAQLPYNPTQLIQNGSLVFVFQPSPSLSSQFELGSVNISNRISTSISPYTTLYPTLPFLDADKPRPFNAILDSGGNLTVYTGDCTAGADGSEVWNYASHSTNGLGNGIWSQQQVASAQGDRHVTGTGPNYLSGGMAFSALVKGNATTTDAFFFGGMCPFPDANDTDWQASANYSNLMVTLQPSQQNDQALNYQLGTSSSRGPPIAEAGFSLTGLSPLFSNQGDGTQTQQQNFVLIAGHTQSAFINTSQVAVFSLPQEGWTFIPVSQPDTSRSDLAIRSDISAIEPRSGHSAVLTPDGSQVVIFGGWIGDTNTPAEPQLAVLNVGDGYGGQGNWEWIAPATSGSGLPNGAGIYGHGATMLPGGVMMVMGGFSMSATGSRRRTTSTINRQTLFFNVSSKSWVDEYSPPPHGLSPQHDENGPLSTPTQKAGLGAGLGIGMAAVLGLVAFYFWYTRRLKRQREAREKQLQELALGAHRYNLGCMSGGVDGRGGQADFADTASESYFYPSIGVPQGQGWRRANNADAERTGLLVEIPSPTRGLRRSLSGRPTQPMARYDDRRVRGSGHIHPIDEADEEQEQDVATVNTPLTSQPEMTEHSSKRKATIFENAPVLDPFTDSNRTSRGKSLLINSAPASPVRDEVSQHEAQSAIGSMIPGHSSPSPDGRVSPTKSSERTGSNLSERSTRSNLSAPSTTGTLSRSASMRASAILKAAQANPFKTPDASPTRDTAHPSSGWRTPADPRAQSLTSIRSIGRSGTASGDADSFLTARSSFMALQAEGEALLGGNPERARPGTASSSDGSYGHSGRDTAFSIAHTDSMTVATSVTDGYSRPGGRERRRSWLGSVKKALGRSNTQSERTRSLTTSVILMDPYTDDPSVEEHTERGNHKSLPTTTPRRAASDASFWKSKRGKQDWLDDEIDASDPRAKWRRVSGDDWGAPEDLALAEKERERREWRERGNLLINLTDDEQLPTPRTPILPGELGVPGTQARPRTPADEDDWDVEAAVERRVVQVMFTVPKSRLRVVNADIDGSSILSLPRENSKDSIDKVEAKGSPASGTAGGSPGRVKDIAGRFEQMSSPRPTSRASPRPSPSPSIKSMKLRGRGSAASLAARKASAGSAASKGKGRARDE